MTRHLLVWFLVSFVFCAACSTDEEVIPPSVDCVGCETGTITDSRDGTVYNTVKIGNQWWMAENLNIGTQIISDRGFQIQTDNNVVEKYCHDNKESNCDIYGGLYEWQEVMQYAAADNGNIGTTQGICPAGWHLPTDAEWQELTNYLGGTGSAGGKIKSWEQFIGMHPTRMQPTKVVLTPCQEVAAYLSTDPSFRWVSWLYSGLLQHLMQRLLTPCN